MNELQHHMPGIPGLFICLFLIPALSLITGCKGPTTSDGKSDITQYRWYVTELSGQEVSGLDGRRPYIEFTGNAQNSVSGFAGCNRFSGTINENSENAIRFSPLAATKMFCENNAIETRLFDALTKVRKADRDGETYTLSAGDTALVRLHGIPLSNIALAGRCELASIEGAGPTISEQYAERIPYVVFDLATRHIGGHTSCNGFSAQYTVNENQIRFENALKTMIACDGGGEERFLDMLNKTTRFELQGDTLIFSNADGETMRFRKG